MKMVLGPQLATQKNSHVELDLPIDWLSMIVVFAILAHVVARIVRILNFFVPNFGSPCCTRSSIIFVLGDLDHQNRILCESLEDDS